jgi:hypothetical protein
MGQVIQLDDYRQVWTVGTITCRACGYLYVSVHKLSEDEDKFECVKCHVQDCDYKPAFPQDVGAFYKSSAFRKLETTSEVEVRRAPNGALVMFPPLLRDGDILTERIRGLEDTPESEGDK